MREKPRDKLLLTFRDRVLGGNATLRDCGIDYVKVESTLQGPSLNRSPAPFLTI